LAPAPGGSTQHEHLRRRLAAAGDPAAAGVLRLPAFLALPAWLWARWLRRNEAPLADALASLRCGCCQEAFRGWFLTGFPWLYSGYSQLDGPLAGSRRSAVCG
jgi:apolipoprotein N-acyltransferase